MANYTIYDLCRAKRQALGLTLVQVADKFGYSNVYISILERNKISRADMAALIVNWLDRVAQEIIRMADLPEFDEVYKTKTRMYLYDILVKRGDTYSAKEVMS